MRGRTSSHTFLVLVFLLVIGCSGILPVLGLGGSQSISSYGTVKYTGFIKVAKQPDGTWLFIDQNGKLFYSLGVTAVRYDNRPNYKDNVMAKYGSLDAWGDTVIQRMRSWGFNTIGSWSFKDEPADSYIAHKGLPHCVAVVDVGRYAHDHGIPLNRAFVPDVFDPRWADLAREGAQSLIGAWNYLIDDDDMIGYFISNDFYIARWNPRQKVEYNEAMFKGDIDELLANQADTDPAKARLIELGYDYHQWLREYAELYYKTVCDAIRSVDPNHLILGARYSAALSIAREDLEAAGRYVDVISANFYDYLIKDSTFQASCREQLGNFHVWSGRPILISEWSVRSNECDPDVTNDGSGGPIVETQEIRGEYYNKTLSEISALPFIVGMHWFMWTDKMVGGENSNFGLVNVNDDPYGFISDVEAANLAVLEARTPV